MFIRSEFSTQAEAVSQLLLYSNLADDGILEQYDGSLLAAWRYQGKDLDSLPDQEAWDLCRQLSDDFNLGSGWMIQTNSCRRPATGYLPVASHPVHPVTELLEDERRKQFLTPGFRFSTERFISLTYLPPSESAQKLSSWFLGEKTKKTSREENERLKEKRLSYFREIIGVFESDFRATLPLMRLKLDGSDDRLLRYLRECVFAEEFPFRRPRLPIYLNTLFRGELIPGEQVKLNGKDLRVLAIDNYPISKPDELRGSYPGIFQQLELLPFQCRFSTRMILMDPEVSAAMHKKISQKWASAKHGMFRNITGWGSEEVNQNALRMEADAKNAKEAAGHGLVQFGHYNAKVILLSSAEGLEDQTRDVREICHRAGFGVRVEDTNLIESWRATLPGDGYSDIRVVPATTENMAHMMPLMSPWLGDPFNSSPNMPPQTPPLMRGVTDGGTPYDYNAHVGETAHTLIVGPNRSGKSTIMAFKAAQWLYRYPGAQLYAFDKRASIGTLIRALDGTFYEFGAPGDRHRVCPLQHLSHEPDRAWASSYLEMLCRINGVGLEPIDRRCISDTLDEMQNSKRRSITEFSTRCRNPRIQGALHFFTVASNSGGALVDGEIDAQAPVPAHVTCFELQYLYQMDEKVRQAVLPYLFRSIERRLDTRHPALISLDEAWLAVNDPIFEPYIDSFLRELSKLNAAVMLATQDLDSIMKSPLKHVILNQCFTNIYLPNSNAVTTEKEHYRTRHLNEQQINLIANGKPKRDYFHHVQQDQRQTFRRFELNLGQVALSFVGANRSSDKAAIAQLQADPSCDWRSAWLKKRGLADWGRQLEGMLAEHAEAACA